MSTAPAYDIDPTAFWEDPYPDLARIQAEAPVAFVPQLRATLFTRRDDIFTLEKQIAIFSSRQPDGLMTRLMGENMMRKDGDDHMRERKAVFPTVSPRTVRDVWTARFRAATEAVLDGIAARGEVDLVRDFAMPVSAEGLKAITGLESMTAEEMDATSQAMIDGCSNYAGDPQVEARCHWGTALIDAHIAQMRPLKAEAPDSSMLSVMMRAEFDAATISANIKLAISGGQNEPRDAIAGTIWALLTHPDALAAVRNGTASWHDAFAEYVRWTSPIGMSPRRIAQPWERDGIRLDPDDVIFFMFGAANRDPAHFERPERYDIQRANTSDHIGFGAGPHFCAGAWASKAMVADVALPMIFARLPDLRLADADQPRMRGWAFRGLQNLPVVWRA